MIKLLSLFYQMAKKPSFLKDIYHITRHEINSKKNRKSYTGEIDTVNWAINYFNISKGYAVDIAASDGLSESCTYDLFKNGWEGLCLEVDPIKFSKLAFLYRKFETVNLQKLRVTPQNIGSILKAAEAPNGIDFLNLDIDSYDLHVLNSIFENSYLPKIISMEINEKIPYEIFFTVDYSDKHFWRGDHFYGCSLSAAYNLLKKYNYSLIKYQLNNALFVNNSILENYNLQPLSPQNAYLELYKYNNNRLKIFPWNKDVDYWQDLETKEAINEINEYFRKYKGKFTCKIYKD